MSTTGPNSQGRGTSTVWSQQGMQWADTRPWRMGRIRSQEKWAWHCKTTELEPDYAWGQHSTDLCLLGDIFIKVSCLSPTRLGQAPDTRLRHTGSSRRCGSVPWEPSSRPALSSPVTVRVLPRGRAELLGLQWASFSGHFHTMSPALSICPRVISEDMWPGGPHPGNPASPGLDLEH